MKQKTENMIISVRLRKFDTEGNRLVAEIPKVVRSNFQEGEIIKILKIK